MILLNGSAWACVWRVLFFSNSYGESFQAKFLITHVQYVSIVWNEDGKKNNLTEHFWPNRVLYTLCSMHKGFNIKSKCCDIKIENFISHFFFFFIRCVTETEKRNHMIMLKTFYDVFILNWLQQFHCHHFLSSFSI